LNVPGIVGFGKAVEIAMAARETESLRISALRDRLQQELAQIDSAFVNGNRSHRLPGNLNIGFDRVNAASLLAVVKNEIAISSGSACSSPEAAAGLASHVLQAVGLSKQAALSCIRVSIGRYTTQDDISTASRCLQSAIETLRRQSSQGISFSPPSITKISQPV
jgi:cysteine desulfurase